MPAACGSLFVVPVSQKGFGAGSSRPSNKKKQAPYQQKGNGILQTSSSDEKKQKKAVVLREGSQELHGVLKSVEKVVSYTKFLLFLYFSLSLSLSLSLYVCVQQVLSVNHLEI